MDICKVVFSLATNNERARTETMRWLRSETQMDAVVKTARDHKVAPAVLQTLDNWETEVPVPVAFRKDIAHIEAQKQFYMRELHELIGSHIVSPQSILILKGRAVQYWYPEQLPRQSIDVDLVTVDEECFWQVCRWLVKRGYEQPSMGGAYPEHSKQGNWHFIFEFEKEFCDSDIQFAVFEILQGITSITSRHFFDFRPVIKRALNTSRGLLPKEANELDTFFLYPTREDCLINLLVEICERLLVLRDAVDFGLLLCMIDNSNTPKLDWQVLSLRIEEEALIMPFLRLMHFYKHISGLPISKEIEATCRRWKQHYPYWRLVARSPVLSVVAPYINQRKGLISAIKEVISTLSSDIRDVLFIEKFGLSSRAPFIHYKALKQEESCIRLLKISDQRSEACQWRSGKEGELLLSTPVGNFLATRSINFTREFLDTVRTHIPDD